MWGGKTYRGTRSPEKFWTPPKELLVCSVADFCRKNRATTPEGGGKRTVRGGVQNPLLGGVSFMRFSFPLFFHPPMASSDKPDFQQVLNPTPLNPSPATCHKRKKLRCNFRKVALWKLHCNICFSAMRTSILPPTAALQQAENCIATLKKPRCKKVALSCCFPVDCRLPRLGSHG